MVKSARGNKKVPEVFSEGQPQGEVFEPKINLRKTNIRDQIEYTHPKWASSKHPGFSSQWLLKLGMGLVVIVCLFVGLSTM